MHLRDLAIRAMDGSAFVEGELRIEGDGDAALPRSAPGEPVNVNLRRRAFGRASFSLHDRVRQASDGLYDASRPVLQVELEETVPDLIELLGRAYDGGARYRATSDRLRVVAVSFREPGTSDAELKTFHADGNDLDLELGLSGDGLRIAFETEVRPTTRIEHIPVFERAKVNCDVLVPAAYCRLQGFHLPSLRAPEPSEPVGAWDRIGPDLPSIPMSAHGSAVYCRGSIDWNDKSGLHRPTGPHVELYLAEHRMTLQPLGELRRLANGYAAEVRSLSGGPQMVLPLGVESLTQFLEVGDEAVIDLRGASVGHVDGQTGWVYESGGPMTQAITRLHLELERSSEGLRVTGRGDLAPLAGDETGRSLGPQLTFDFLIPRAWILARGLRLPRFWEDRKKDFPSADTW